MPLTGVERNRLYRERKKAERADAAPLGTSAGVTDSDPPVDVDIDMSSSDEPMDVDTSDESSVASTGVDDGCRKRISVRELWEARWATSNTRFKKVSTDDFGLECSVAARLWFPRDLTQASNKHVQVLCSRFTDDFNTLKSSPAVRYVQAVVESRQATDSIENQRLRVAAQGEWVTTALPGEQATHTTATAVHAHPFVLPRGQLRDRRPGDQRAGRRVVHGSVSASFPERRLRLQCKQ
jgi:hypothetical protein